MPHGIWKGTLGFGLVNIAVELFAAEVPNELDLDLLDRRDLSRIGYRKYNKSTGREVESDDIVKGMEVSKGKYVILSDADLKEANLEATQSIEILGFVEREHIPLVYFARPYYVTPLKGSERAYALLRDALHDDARVGIAQIVIRTRQHVCAIYPYEASLVVQLLRYRAELRAPKDLAGSLPGAKPRPKESAMARQLIDSMVTAWKPEQYHDAYRDDLLALVKQRAAHPAKAGATAPSRARKEPRVLDLVAALERSVASHRAGAKRTAPASSRARRAHRRSA